MTANLFPLGIALGAAFCNRTQERASLAQNLIEGRHLFLSAPRRYGKTSLMLQVLQDLDNTKDHPAVAWCSMDFLISYDEKSIQDILLEGIGQITAKIIPFHKKAVQQLQKAFTSLKPELSISVGGPRIRFFPSGQSKEGIIDALEGLDKLAGEQGVRAIILMDEFQQISTTKNTLSVEAAIRHAVERAKNTSYIFSGSNRHMLMHLFEDNSRPLYHLCDRLSLNRISFDEYKTFIQAASQNHWAKSLDDEIISQILTLTVCHPYYVNLLCSRLWRLKTPPDLNQVGNIWQEYVLEERNRFSREVSALSPNQRAVLAALAASPTDKPLSKDFLSSVRLAGTSVAQATQVLLENDTIYRDENETLRLLDPALESYLLSLTC